MMDDNFDKNLKRRNATLAPLSAEEDLSPDDIDAELDAIECERFDDDEVKHILGPVMHLLAVVPRITVAVRPADVWLGPEPPAVLQKVKPNVAPPSTGSTTGYIEPEVESEVETRPEARYELAPRRSHGSHSSREQEATE